MAEQSLYQRLGGVNAISMVVDRFGDAIVENPKLNENPALRVPEREALTVSLIRPDALGT